MNWWEIGIDTKLKIYRAESAGTDLHLQELGVNFIFIALTLLRSLPINTQLLQM